jgi:hypothetical protein
MRRHAASDHVGFWAELARRSLHWHRPFTVTLDDSMAPNYHWFPDGELNVSINCLDVHLAGQGDKTAILFEGEAGEVRRLSYRELHAEVCRLANGLKQLGIGRGDRVVIYMPMVPEAVIAMQACARIGAVHSVVFGGFSYVSIRDLGLLQRRWGRVVPVDRHVRDRREPAWRRELRGGPAGPAGLRRQQDGPEHRVHVDTAVVAGNTLVAEEAVEVALAAAEIEKRPALQAADDFSKGFVPQALSLGRPTNRLGRVAVVPQLAVEEAQEFLFPVGVHKAS